MRVLWLSAAVVLLDQATKAAVVQLMYRHQSIPLLGDWLRLTFTENPGMAFGLTIGPTGTVTVLSLVATALVALYVYRIRHAYAPYRWSLGLILGGAVGNIIDRVFYSVMLDYGPLFTGRVVDFIHVSLWRGFIPNVVPLLGGSYLELFPIWNVADMAIVLGVVGVMFFHRPFLNRQQANRASASEEVDGMHVEGTASKAATDDASPAPSTSRPDATNGTGRPHPASLSLPSPPRRDE